MTLIEFGMSPSKLGLFLENKPFCKLGNSIEKNVIDLSFQLINKVFQILQIRIPKVFFLLFSEGNTKSSQAV